MRQQSDRFIPFIANISEFNDDMFSYVQREVEPMGKECEQVQIIALTEYLDVPVKIEYLDGHLFDENLGLNNIQTLEHKKDATFKDLVVNLLYRPGHYDVLYSSN